MKTRVLILCAVLLASLLVGGCAFMSSEDRDFYGKGWVHPTDLDTPDNRHSYADAGHPVPTSAAPAPVKRESEPEWIVPETSENHR